MITEIKAVPSLKRLENNALKYIFDKSHMTVGEERELDEGLQDWTRKAKMLPYEKNMLQIIVNALLRDKAMGYDKQKFFLKKEGIDYKQAYAGGL